MTSTEQVLAMDWERLIPGQTGPGGRRGTQQDAKDQPNLLQDACEAVKGPAREGKCWKPAEKAVKLPKYESRPNYEQNLPFDVLSHPKLIATPAKGGFSMGALTDTRIRNLKPREKAYQVADSNGVAIEVRPVGHKAWPYRYRLYGKQEKLTLAATVSHPTTAKGMR